MNVQHKKGFTLIELIVSIGIFSIVMTLVASTYFSLISASGDMRTSTSAIDNVTFALNAMSYDIRSGECTLGQCGNGSSFTFTNSSKNDVTYSLCGSEICKKIGIGTSYALTHLPVKINVLNFSSQTYTSTGPPKASQTLTTIRIEGGYTLPRHTKPSTFHFETVVTPRKIYIQ